MITVTTTTAGSTAEITSPAQPEQSPDIDLRTLRRMAVGMYWEDSLADAVVRWIAGAACDDHVGPDRCVALYEFARLIQADDRARMPEHGRFPTPPRGPDYAAMARRANAEATSGGHPVPPALITIEETKEEDGAEPVYCLVYGSGRTRIRVRVEDRHLPQRGADGLITAFVVLPVWGPSDDAASDTDTDDDGRLTACRVAEEMRDAHQSAWRRVAIARALAFI